MKNAAARSGDLAALVFGTQSLVLTGAWRVARGHGAQAGQRFLTNLAHRPQYLAVLSLLALGLALRAVVHARARDRERAIITALLASLIALDPFLSVVRPPGWLLVAHSVVAMLLAASLIVPGCSSPRTLTLRGMYVILGMIIFDMTSDLPFLLFQRQLELSYLNNTVHNGTIVHRLWLPLSLVSVGLGIALTLWRERDRRIFVLIPLLAIGGLLLYGIVEPSEATLAAHAPSSPQAARLLQHIGWSHVASAVILVASVALISRRE